MPGRSPLQPSTIGRPALEQRLDAALLERRLTCVVAGPGFGKTTLLSHWAETTPHAMSAWHGMTTGRPQPVGARAGGHRRPAAVRPGAAGRPGHRGGRAARSRHGHRRVRPGPGVRRADLRRGGRGAAPPARPRRSTTSSCSTGAAESAAFLAALCRQASPPLHVIVASRGDVPFPVARLRGQGLLAELSAADLAFTAAETAGGARAPPSPRPTTSTRSPTLAAELHEHDGRVARGRAPDRRGAGPGRAGRAPLGPRPACARPGGVVHDYLADEVVAGEPEPTRRLLVRLSVLDRFTPDLAEALGPGDTGTLAGLVRRGLVVDAPGRGARGCGSTPCCGASPRAGAAPEARAATLAVAAAWLADHDQPAAAVRCALAAGATTGGRRSASSRPGGRDCCGPARPTSC